MSRYAIVTLSCMLGFGGGCAHFSNSDTEWIRTCTGQTFDGEEATKLNQKALELLHLGKTEKARLALLRAIEADATFGPAKNNLGRIYFSRRRLYEAAWKFQEAMEQMPESIEPINNLGLVYESADRLDDAIAIYHQAHELAPTNAVVIGNLVRAKMKRGDDFCEIEPMLNDLLFYDSRGCWVDWAREHLAMAYKRHDSNGIAYEVDQKQSERPLLRSPQENHEGRGRSEERLGPPTLQEPPAVDGPNEYGQVESDTGSAYVPVDEAPTELRSPYEPEYNPRFWEPLPVPINGPSDAELPPVSPSDSSTGVEGCFPIIGRDLGWPGHQNVAEFASRAWQFPRTFSRSDSGVQQATYYSRIR